MMPKMTFEEMLAKYGPQTSGKKTLDAQVPFTRIQPGETNKEKEARLLKAGWHPTGVDRLAVPVRGCCAECAHFVESPFKYESRKFFKCTEMKDRWTGGRATDCLARWPICVRFVPKEEG